MKAIEVINLEKSFGKIKAVDMISFSVEQGNIFGFLGPNGAGKSTTQRILTGVISPDSGSAQIMGYDIKKEPLKAKEQMGVVPEQANVYGDLSAWDNLAFMGEIFCVPKEIQRKRSEELLQLFGLYERRHEKAKVFSKGMRQRLLLCMSMISDPEILFLDEPTGGLDVHSTRIIRELIKEFNSKGKTIFLTTHNIEEANILCDYVAIINHGQIAAVDRPENLRHTLNRLQVVEIAFSPDLQLSESLSSLEEVTEVTKSGDKYSIYTEYPGKVILNISDLAREKQLNIISLHTLKPSLEDVFVELTSGEPGKEVNTGV